jgi:hypothetical protein
MNEQEMHSVDGDISMEGARARLRAALVHTHTTRTDMDEVEAAAGDFCRLHRLAGHSPERALLDAKAVIEETIDGHDATVAERAVTRCIERFFHD